MIGIVVIIRVRIVVGINGVIESNRRVQFFKEVGVAVRAEEGGGGGGGDEGDAHVTLMTPVGMAVHGGIGCCCCGGGGGGGGVGGSGGG